MKKIGLIVNPIAGMGGSVGLKGTDGNLYKKALELGAKAVAPIKVRQFLESLTTNKELKLYIAPNKMGADYIESAEFEIEVIGNIKEVSSADDTKRITKLLIDEKVDLIIFFGGDGTARDIYDVVGLKLPVVGVPSGVKMFSSVFTINPRAAAELVNLFILERTEFEEREVLD
ncbi:MAG: ATP-NAD kinase family protein, partial [Candidatus Hermodarchaeota archaeon]